MGIFVGGRLIQTPGALSEMARLVLVCIDGGTQWLDWAMRAQARYEFADESELVNAVQVGLHASGQILLPGLQLLVGPIKLMTLGSSELRCLLKAEAGDNSAVLTEQVRRVLAAHELHACGDLRSIQSFLAEAGVLDAPVFQAMTLLDRLMLCEMLRESPAVGAASPELQQEAARFGVQQGRTPQEFADYYQSYLLQVGKPSRPADSERRRFEQVDVALQTLLPLLFETLDCVQVDGLVAPQEVLDALRAWFARGRRLGFQQLSSGVLQIIRDSDFTTETGEAARRLVERHLNAARAVIDNGQAPRAAVGQDGASAILTFASGQQQTVLQLTHPGVISLRRYATQRSAAPSETDHALLEDGQ